MSTIAYFKRFRMEIDLNDLPPPEALPPGYAWTAWDETLLELHADVKAQCFAEEIDSVVFPSLSSRDGCYHLMREISRKAGFLPDATWLITHNGSYCATVQGVRERSGLGRALLLKALYGFWRAGLGRAHLEVTAQNDAAVRLYRRVGFRCRKTIYKAVDTAPVLQPTS